MHEIHESYSPELKAIFERQQKRRLRHLVILTILIIIASGVYAVVSSWGQGKVDVPSLVVTSVLTLGVWVYYWFTRYRMKKGYYGGNAHEAEEVVGEIIAQRKRGEL